MKKEIGLAIAILIAVTIIYVVWNVAQLFLGFQNITFWQALGIYIAWVAIQDIQAISKWLAKIVMAYVIVYYHKWWKAPK